MMKRTRIIEVALIAGFVMSVLATPVAQGIEAPFFSVEKNMLESKRLKAGESKAFTATGITSFKLEALGNSITCTSQKLISGSAVIEGSSKGEPGTNLELLEFSGCSGKSGTNPCTIPGGVITTQPLQSELGYLLPESKKVGVEFFPKTGSLFMKIKQTGTGCIEQSTVTGNLVAEELNESKENIELGKASPEQKVGFIRFPATPIKKFLLVKNSVSKSVPIEWTWWGGEAAITGTSELKLTSGEKWSVLP